MSARVLLPLVILAGCIGRDDATPPSGDASHLGSVGFDVPKGWRRSDLGRPGISTSVWTPDDRDNTRKESITVVQGATSGAQDDRALEQLLVSAQAAYLAQKTSRVIPIKTESGLSGFSITAEFISQRVLEPYRRVHVVLRDGGRLVHVIYTARTFDPQRRALETVLKTIHHEEAAS